VALSSQYRGVRLRVCLFPLGSLHLESRLDQGFLLVFCRLSSSFLYRSDFGARIFRPWYKSLRILPLQRCFESYCYLYLGGEVTPCLAELGARDYYRASCSVSYGSRVEHVAHRKKKQYDPMSPPQLPTFGTVPILPHTFQIVLRLSRPRTWTFAASSFILGYMLAGGSSLFQMAIGLVVAGLVTAATNVVNAFADRKEDAVNQP